MKKIKILAYTLALMVGLQSAAIAEASDGTDKLKKYINDVVQKVEQAENAEKKRSIMNESFDKLINVFEQVENMNRFSEEEVTQVKALKDIIVERKDELNGNNGFAAVQSNQLNDYANYVQQDLEQADPYVTISAGLAVVIVLLLLLL